jgi:hypothetical protein
LVGGILIAIANPIAFLSGVYADTSSGGALMLFALLVLIGIELVLLGLVGIYVSQAETIGASGLIGFLLTFLGMTMIAGLYWARAFVVPPLQPAPAGLLLTIPVSALAYLRAGHVQGTHLPTSRLAGPHDRRGAERHPRSCHGDCARSGHSLVGVLSLLGAWNCPVMSDSLALGDSFFSFEIDLSEER